MAEENEKKVRLVEMSRRPPMRPYKNIGVYVRVSSSLRPQLDSMASQVSAFTQQVNKNGYWRLADIYIDVRSGAETESRSEFRRMLDDAKNGKLDQILTKSVSRFGRNTEAAIQALRELNKCGVSVTFDEEKISSGDVGSEFLISVLSAYAEGDNASQRKNQLWSIQKRLEDGSSEYYTRECYGYRKNEGGQLEICEEEAVVVRKIYDLYLAGASVVMIRKCLAAEGIKTAKGKDTWSKLAIEKMLSNEKYVGDVRVAKPQGQRKGKIEVSGGYLATDNHPAIIPREVFAAVQEEKQRRSNTIIDENGKHRKETRYSAPKEIANK